VQYTKFSSKRLLNNISNLMMFNSFFKDGSYWRKYQRNKRIRLEEKAREAAAKLWMDRKGKV
jgi:hypothetical protein